MVSPKTPQKLAYVSDDRPGIARKRRGKGFIYLDERNRRIQNGKILDRIKSLVIPPMWDDVWICPFEYGHLQSTGKDGKKRKQYIYHPEWMAHQQQLKFDKLADFGKSLCTIRARIREDLKLKGWPKTRVTALTVNLLDDYLFRVGNEQYVKQNQSYGLTTLRRKHMQVDGETLLFSYKAKSGKQRIVKILNKRTAKMIREMSELPGQEIFCYVDESGITHKLDSTDVNDYIHDITGSDFTAKDFRTWGGTKLILQLLPDAFQAVELNSKLKLETQLIKAVSNVLGNTIAVCRSYYVHPKVFDYALQTDIASYTKDLASCEKSKHGEQLDKYEKLILKILS